MTVPANTNALLLRSAAPATYQVSRSLRFSAPDSSYLSRTPASAGNRKTWTWAGWVKRSGLSSSDEILLSARTDASNRFLFGFNLDGTSQKLSVYLNNAGSTTQVDTSATYRDFSAWYHILLAVDTTQSTSTNRIRIYINGVEQTLSGSYPAQNYDTQINNTVGQYIATRDTFNSSFFSGYLAEIHHIDGQALTPSSFAETDATTGQWIPKTYSGSKGSLGYHLEFADNSNNTASTLGKDAAGSNNWTPNNFSVTAGAGNDSLVDTPTSFGSDTGVGNEVRGNYCTWNPLNKGSNLTISNGNLDVSSATGHATVLTTIPVVAGIKSYMEFTVTTDGSGGWGVTTNPAAENSYGEIAGKWWAYDNGGNFVIINQTSTGNYSPRVNNGDVLQLAIDYSTGKVHLGINNTWINSTNGTDGNPATGANPTFTLSTTAPIFPIFESNGLYAAANFGQRAFAYTAPSGFKALCDTNLPAPVVAKPNTVMDVKTYTGNGSTQTISGLGFSPDLVWIKARSAAYNHELYDTIRGALQYLSSSTTNAESTLANSLTAFGSDGFSVGSQVGSNGSGTTFAAWTWDAGTSTASNTQGSITSSVRANASAGFSIVSFNSGSNGQYTIGHGLGVAPALILCKARDSALDWQVFHVSATTTVYKYFWLNATQGVNTDASKVWGDNLPTSTVFGFSTGNNQLANKNIICYCFSPVAGYSAMGSYTGNGSASGDGPFVFCGFRPRFILTKRTDSTNNWTIVDAARNTYNTSNSALFPNLSAQESTNAEYAFDILSNGFKVRGTPGDSVNVSGGTYIYFAVAENPFVYARAR